METEKLLPPHGLAILRRIIERLDNKRADYGFKSRHLKELVDQGVIRTDISKDIKRYEDSRLLYRECVLEVGHLLDELSTEMRKSGIRYAI